ncbi:S8 family serine peptidase [Paenibacillus agilis]|uniref:S8 family serine peptidase n=1 Tax=Paenibacillus agilis TaxID=3020863 RepID=A0A559IGM3_9BACL|nr:S8 family serine peptidase [Paenibacillus agilis]TVX86784.1 S8 family serine peptidase [Paenibacillus agilis]
MMKRKMIIGLSMMLSLSLLAPAIQPTGYAEPGAEPARTVFLKSGQIDLKDYPAQESMFHETPSQSPKLYIVQFKDVITNESKQLLKQHGAEVGNYLPDFAYLVRITDQQAISLSTSNLVYSVSRFLPTWKEGTFATVDSIPNEYVLSTFKGSEASVASLIQTIAPQQLSVSSGSIEATLTDAHIQTLIQTEEITYVEPKLQTDISNDFIAAQVKASTPNGMWSRGLTGTGQVVAVADSGLDTGDVSTLHGDFQGQLQTTPFAVAVPGNWSDADGHGTHVAGTVLGTGALSNGQYKGIAPGAKLVFQAIGCGTKICPGDLRTLFGQAQSNGAKIHTNSWGSPVNTYNSMAAQVDEYTFANKTFNVLFAAGNYGSEANTLATPATSKNSISVANLSKKANNISMTSSRGYAFDGRVKPDLAVTGSDIISPRSAVSNRPADPNTYYTRMSGTSMATPAVAGAIAIVRQHFMDVKQVEPTAALVKAILINGAKDVGFGWGSREIGWGRVDLESSLYPTDGIKAQHEDHTTGIQTGDVKTYSVTIGSGQPLKISTVWTDYQAAVQSAKALVNDLDLEVTSPTGEVFKGNCFVSNNASSTCAAFDRINNVENVYFNTANAGTYTIKVKAYNVPQGTQPFALVVSGSNASLSVGGGSQPQPTDLQAPINVSVSAKTQNSATLTWTDQNVHTTAPTYEIFSNNQLVGASATTSAVVTQLQAGTTYSFTVKVRAGTLLSPASLPVSGTTDSTNPNPGSGALPWKAGQQYKVHDLVTYNNATYRVIQAHYSLTGWEPSNVPALWAKVN